MSLRDWLQRLYMHEETAKLMRSHDRSLSGKIVHSCDGEAWQHFGVEYLDFASDRRNVRLAIAIDGRFALGNGAVRAADIRATAKEGSSRASTTTFIRGPSNCKATGSSHVGSESSNGSIDAEGHHSSKDQDGADRVAVGEWQQTPHVLTGS
ncbi:hypothetical protein U9M48_001021 [Paspalum notatum var. saurae]|uniref:Uncharacterized protein n=1 Tax=Paspalum notatum var. saurae TaxID=547442 RepID=A0AAQ3PHK1_PASNO